MILIVLHIKMTASYWAFITQCIVLCRQYFSSLTNFLSAKLLCLRLTVYQAVIKLKYNIRHYNIPLAINFKKQSIRYFF